MMEMGQGSGGERSVGGGAESIDIEEKDVMSSESDDFGGPSREWWAGFGTVTGALEGLRFAGFDLKEEGGKCLFL